MNFNEVFLIVVLYKTSLIDSETIESLNESLDIPINLLVFDNSLDRQYKSDNFVFKKFNVRYYHDGINHGLSVAYNVALEQASKLNKKWLLLLDQDTVFTKKYIDEIMSIDFSKIPNTVAAIIPKVVSLGKKNSISPAKMLTGGLCRTIEINSGISHTPITGINSGTLVNIQFIKSIFGFNQTFPLDMLDHWYFREIYKSKKEVLVLNSVIFQNLSVAGKFEETVSVERYEKMLIAEKMFVKEDGMLGVLIFKLRLFRRALKQFNFNNKMYFYTSVISIFK
jgi:GT2 family glycosyltransferase